MERLQRAAVLLSLIEKLKEKGSWCGETHIQKSVYFLNKLFDNPLEYEYILYKYGPYSFELTDELTHMRADSLLRFQLCPPYGPSIIPGKESGSIKERFPKTISRYESKVNFVAEKLGDKSASELERLATALYVTLELSIERKIRAEQICKLKPHVSIEDARDSINLIDQILEESQDIAA